MHIQPPSDMGPSSTPDICVGRPIWHPEYLSPYSTLSLFVLFRTFQQSKMHFWQRKWSNLNSCKPWGNNPPVHASDLNSSSYSTVLHSVWNFRRAPECVWLLWVQMSVIVCVGICVCVYVSVYVHVRLLAWTCPVVHFITAEILWVVCKYCSLVFLPDFSLQS